ncbi:MAG: BRO family protein [Bacteroidota bacterium]
MKKDIVCKLTENFEDFLHKTEDGVEFWLARDLQHLLGYGKWDNFQNVISKAKTACEISGQDISDHFADVGKMVDIGSGAKKVVDDVMLTRFACYLIAQNGDPRKEQIAFAQSLILTMKSNEGKRIYKGYTFVGTEVNESKPLSFSKKTLSKCIKRQQLV